jgi:hypothetical protein
MPVKCPPAHAGQWERIEGEDATLICRASARLPRCHHRLPSIKHSVEVTAESLYEAGVMAVAALRQAGWVEEVPGRATRLEIEVQEPVVKHTVTLAQLQRWVSGAATSPAERIRRQRMREMLSPK